MEKPEPLWQQQGADAQKEPHDPEKERRHTKGIIWLLLPIISLPFVLSAYAITRFVAFQLSQNAPTTGEEGLVQASQSTIIFQIISAVLALIPLVAIPVGLIVGLYYLLKK